jgi:hypothetical protein
MVVPRRRSDNKRDQQRRHSPPQEWVAALKQAAFRADASDDGYRVPSNAVISALLAEGLSEWLPTAEAVQKWYRQQHWGGWVSSESCARPASAPGPARGPGGRFVKGDATGRPTVDRVIVLTAAQNGLLEPPQLAVLQQLVGGAIHTQDRQRLVQDMRPKSKDSHGKSFKFFDRFHPKTANPATRASRNVMDFVQRTRLLENIETLMVKYLRDRNVSEATLRRTEPKAHMFFAHCYGARKRDGMKFHVDDVSLGAAVYCVSGDNGERGLYWATSDNEETCDVIEVPLQPGDLAFIISGTHHGVHHVKRKVPRITLNIFM